MTSIVVSVRVRPFNAREMKYQSKLIVAMAEGGITEVTQVRQGKLLTNEAPKKFTFDNAFWSHDPKAPNFASQEIVYDVLGKSILSNALEGFNGCLFAYGQTGSGKTYTMMGAAGDPGVIPRLTEDLFQRVDANPNMTVRVECSFLEIYNEQVRDLLNPAGVNQSLRVRQHPKMGVFVEGLRKIATKDKPDIERLIDDGMKVRSVASTNMNATSSRSHGIITLNLLIRNEDTELSSQLHLVDLAGSERATSTGATGDTLTEGSNINKSLTTLGMCLSRLAEVASSNSKSAGHVPFRDSQLTWLLHDSLGGNSKTAMLANISPADINFEETLSTLRFAQTTKKIKMHAKVNEDPQQKLIRELREEIAAIKELIKQREAGNVPTPISRGPSVANVDDQAADSADGDHDNNDGADGAAASAMDVADADANEAQGTEELIERLMNDADELERLHQTDEQRHAEEEARRAEHEQQMRAFMAQHGAVFVDHTRPQLHLLNDNIAQLCPGQESSVQLLYYLQPTPANGGDPQIAGTASDAWLPLPCVNDQMGRRMLALAYDEAAHTVTATNAGDLYGGSPSKYVWINGRPLEQPVALSDGDRVIIGPFAFRFAMPDAGGDADEEDFDREPTTTRHLEKLEEYERLVLLADEGVAASDLWDDFRSGTPGLESSDEAADMSAELMVADAAQEEAIGLGAVRFRLAEVEKALCRDYPVKATKTTSGGSGATVELDYAAAIGERNEHAAMTSALQQMAELKRKEAESDLEIARLREELERRKQEKAAKAAAEGSGGVASGEASPGSEALDAPEPSADGSESPAGAQSPKSRWKRALRKVSAVENLKRPNLHSRFAAEEKMALAQELQLYEEACRNAQAWQPNGPVGDPVLAAEYQYSLSNPTLASMRTHDRVLFESHVHKLRIKTGFFSRSGYHKVFLVALPFTFAYYDKMNPETPARAAVFFYGASIQPMGAHEGKHAIRIDPAVPRKAGKSGRDNAVILGFDTADEADGMLQLLRQHAVPEPSDRVRDFLRKEDEDAAAEQARARAAPAAGNSTDVSPQR